MKQLVVTGLATEQSFSNGEANYFLILSGGIRIPVQETIAESIIKLIMVEDTSSPEEEEQTEADEHEDESSWQDEAGIGQV